MLSLLLEALSGVSGELAAQFKAGQDLEVRHADPHDRP